VSPTKATGVSTASASTRVAVKAAPTAASTTTAAAGFHKAGTAAASAVAMRGRTSTRLRAAEDSRAAEEAEAVRRKEAELAKKAEDHAHSTMEALKESVRARCCARSRRFPHAPPGLRVLFMHAWCVPYAAAACASAPSLLRARCETLPRRTSALGRSQP
jgi:hypothetical protein